MGYLDSAVPIAELGQRNLWVLWGKSNSGKTELGSTFPKPILYLRFGDDGSNTIANVGGVKAISIEGMEKPKKLTATEHLKEVAKELQKDKQYKTIFVDTFSMHTNVWIDENAVQKNKKMTQQMWGDLKVEQEELVKIFHKVASNHIVVLSCHEASDNIEGMEDEILPDIRPSITKGARTFLEGMANYGIHTTKLKKTITKGGVDKEVVRYAAHLGANPYYWTKFQVDKGTDIPEVMFNPTYDKIIKLLGGE
jgi:hypothetical protein